MVEMGVAEWERIRGEGRVWKGGSEWGGVEGRKWRGRSGVEEWKGGNKRAGHEGQKRWYKM